MHQPEFTARPSQQLPHPVEPGPGPPPRTGFSGFACVKPSRHAIRHARPVVRDLEMQAVLILRDQNVDPRAARGFNRVDGVLDQFLQHSKEEGLRAVKVNRIKDMQVDDIVQIGLMRRHAQPGCNLCEDLCQTCGAGGSGLPV